MSDTYDTLIPDEIWEQSGFLFPRPGSRLRTTPIKSLFQKLLNRDEYIKRVIHRLAGTVNWDDIPPSNIQSLFNQLQSLSSQSNTINASLTQHKTAAILDHPDNSVIDSKIGNRTINDNLVPSTDTDNLTTLLSNLANRIKSITGFTDWKSNPPDTLTNLNYTVARKNVNEFITGAWTFNNNVVSTQTITASRFVSTVATGTEPLVITSNTRVNNLNADFLDGYDSADFPRKAENATISGAWTFNNIIYANIISPITGNLTVNNNVTITGDLTVEGGANAIILKESSTDTSPGYVEKINGSLKLTYSSTNPVQIQRGATTSPADLEIVKDPGNGALPIYLRFHQSSRHAESIKATPGLISFVDGNDTDFIDIQAKRITANQDLVVSGRTIVNSSGILYAPLPSLGNRDRDLLVDRVAVWGDSMYPFALDLYRSDGWFAIPRTVYYNGQNILGSNSARSGTTRILRMYIVGIDNSRNIYDPTNQHWNNGRLTGIPWIRLIRGNNTWHSPLINTWGDSPDVKVYIIELPTSFLNYYFEVALGIWWDSNSPSWPTANIPGDNIPNNYQNYGVDIQWTVYQVWFEIYDRY